MRIKFPTIATNLSDEQIRSEVAEHGRIQSVYNSYTILDHKNIIRIEAHSELGTNEITGTRVVQSNGDEFYTTMLPRQVLNAINEADSREIIFKSDVTRQLMYGHHKN